MAAAKNSQADERVQSGGIGGDFRRLKADGSQSVEELREFLGELRGKRPQEVMGLVAASSLTWGILLATAGFIILLSVFTVGPYLYQSSLAGGANAGEPDAKQTAAAKAQNDGNSKSEDTGSDADQTAAADASVPDLKNAAKTLGIDETKTADPKANPLDKKLDSLLDGVD